MRKAICVTLAVLMVLCLVGCGEPAKSTDSDLDDKSVFDIETNYIVSVGESKSKVEAKLGEGSAKSSHEDYCTYNNETLRITYSEGTHGNVVKLDTVGSRYHVLGHNPSMSELETADMFFYPGDVDDTFKNYPIIFDSTYRVEALYSEGEFLGYTLYDYQFYWG